MASIHWNFLALAWILGAMFLPEDWFRSDIKDNFIFCLGIFSLAVASILRAMEKHSSG